MNFVINRDLFLSNLNDVSKAMSNKPQQPVASGIKIDVKENEISLLATNSEIAIQAIIPLTAQLTIEKTGTVVLPGKYLLDIVKKSEAKDIKVTKFESNVVKIIAGRSEVTMNTLDIEAFPIVNLDRNGVELSIDVMNLKQIIKKTAFAAGNQDEQLVLTGVNAVTNGNKLEVVATDRYRLAKKHIIFPNELEKISVIFPSKSLDDLNKILDDSEDIVNINISSAKAVFTFKNITFRTRLIKGAFPNTDAIIPHDFITKIKFNKQDLMATIDRASLFVAQDSASIIKLALNKDGNVLISSVNNEIGSVEETIKPISCSDIIPFQTAFSYRYLLDSIRAFDSNEIVISFTGEIRPFVLTGEYDINYIQLIVPVRA